MGFFDDIASPFRSVAGAVSGAVSSVFRPVAGALAPVINKGGALVERVGGRILDRVDRVAEGATRAAEGLGDGLGNLFKGPFLYLMIGVVAIVVLPRVLSKEK
jgi:hypothetical protein